MFAVGFPVAYWIAGSGWRQRLFLLLLIIPFWSSFLVRTYAIGSLLADGGPLDQIHARSGPRRSYIQSLPLAVGIGIVYSYLPLMVLPLYVALERLDPVVAESAQDLGAAPGASSGG